MRISFLPSYPNCCSTLHRPSPTRREYRVPKSVSFEMFRWKVSYWSKDCAHRSLVGPQEFANPFPKHAPDAPPPFFPKGRRENLKIQPVKVTASASRFRVLRVQFLPHEYDTANENVPKFLRSVLKFPQNLYKSHAAQ